MSDEADFKPTPQVGEFIFDMWYGIHPITHVDDTGYYTKESLYFKDAADLQKASWREDLWLTVPAFDSFDNQMRFRVMYEFKRLLYNVGDVPVSGAVNNKFLKAEFPADVDFSAWPDEKLLAGYSKYLRYAFKQWA